MIAPSSLRRQRFCGLAALLLFLFVFACTHQSHSDPTGQPGPFKIGAVLDFTGALSEFGKEAKNGALLAVAHLNRAGGILGRPVELTFADGATDPEKAVAAARRLVDQAGVHVLVGAMGSESTLHLARRVTIPAGVPTITPSATAPKLSRLDDDGYLFRTTPSDAAQGAVLARLAHDEGYSRVAVFYRDDAYGHGLLESFTAHYRGAVEARPVDDKKESYLGALTEVADCDALLAFTFPFEAEIFVSEAVEHDLFDRFLFTDATRSLELVRKMGSSLDGMKGTAPAVRTASEVPSTAAFFAGYQEEFGQLPLVGPVAATYDSVICFGLAAERAGSTEGSAIRDALPAVCGTGGDTYIASADSVAAALRAARAGAPVNYDGAASSVDWNEAGEISRGLMDVWQYQDGGIASLERVPFDLSG